MRKISSKITNIKKSGGAGWRVEIAFPASMPSTPWYNQLLVMFRKVNDPNLP
jgi:hypothetical protein